MKLFSKNILLPVFVLFSYFFYLFWAYPVSFLNRAFSISEWHIFNNFFVLLSIGITILYAVFLYILHKKSSKFYKIAIGIVYFVIALSTLYPYILPYSYGFFQDNFTLTPSESLLGFSKLYYLLDLLLITFVSSITYFSVKNNINFLPLILLIFYTVENVSVMTSTTIQPQFYSDKNITFSLNHKNVILFLHDALSGSEIDRQLNDIWSIEEKQWLNDFTHYKNIFNILGGTLTSMPSILGGYKYTSQFHISEINKNNITTKHPRATEFKYLKKDLNNPHYFFWDEAIGYTDKVLDNQVSTKFMYIHTDDIVTPPSNTFENIWSPILAVSLYNRTPYVLRPILVNKKNNIWRKKLNFSFKWVKINSDYNLIFKKTDKPTINIIHSWGTHLPLYFPGIDQNDDFTSNQIKTIDYTFSIDQKIINKLKEHNIYDSSKIILTSDHGGTINPYTQKDIPTYIHYQYMDTFMMVKDFNTTNSILTTDSRSLSSPDIHAIIVTSFTNIPGYIDYTKVLPPRRMFNVPTVSWPTLVYHMDKENSAEHIKEAYRQEYKANGNNGNMSYIQIESKDKFLEHKILYHPLDKLDQLPPYEIVE